MKVLRIHPALALFLLAGSNSCQKNTYPCPDIQGGTQVVKPGSTEDLKKPKVDFDENGLLNKKRYTHPGVKKKKT
jgi:hypothetical protein